VIVLSREIRFALVPPDRINDRATANSWAGWPATNLIVPQLVLRCAVEGEPDPETGYLCNIKEIDDLLRSIVITKLLPAKIGTHTAEVLLTTVFHEFRSAWKLPPRLASLTLALSPYLIFSIKTVGSQNMNLEKNQMQLTQQFEFSAAHRLHCDELSDAENINLFGKCNNPEGHGHNYVVEVTVARDLDDVADAGVVVGLEEFETTVKRLVVDPLDHKHLNRDVEYFANVNPSVENIAILLFNWLDEQFETAKLQTVRVYETPKTWAEYSGV
jgi:6-pyruvoyltetrahydropterin/6-carboxytetrahydropterin synthase